MEANEVFEQFVWKCTNLIQHLCMISVCITMLSPHEVFLIDFFRDAMFMSYGHA